LIMSGNFLLAVKHCKVYVIWCLLFLYLHKFHKSLVLDRHLGVAFIKLC
jgi:hypothetical protein